MQLSHFFRIGLTGFLLFLSLAISTAQAQTALTGIEQADMTYIREEEKLEQLWKTPRRLGR